MTRVISFSSGKGGVGKSTVVVNLASLWAKQGKRILIVDGDWSLGKMGLLLGVKPKYTVEDVVKGTRELDEALEPVSENLTLLASPSGKLGFEELDEGGRNQLYYDFERLYDRFDAILLDHSSGVHWNVLQFAAAAHQHVIVTTMEPTSYTDAYAIMKLLAKRFGIHEFSLLATMVADTEETDGAVKRFIETVQNQLSVRLQLAGTVPWDPAFRGSLKQGKPYVETHPQGSLTDRFFQLCRKIDGTRIQWRNGLNFFYRQQHHIQMRQSHAECSSKI